MTRTLLLIFCFLMMGFYTAKAQTQPQNKFKQLYEELPTPDEYHNAAGAPGHNYWQQKVDYDMKITLDDATQRIYGEEVITYHNQSPDQLNYIWLQLDQNMRAPGSDRELAGTGTISAKMEIDDVRKMNEKFDGGFKIDFVKNDKDQPLPYTVNRTMMRIDPPTPIKAGDTYVFKVKWWYNINDRMKIGGRSGYEFFEEEDNYLYTIAQFYPRLCVYNEIDGWQNKQFLGRGEFTLNFGDYKVALTVPADHVVASTGLWDNIDDVLTKTQKDRLDKAKESFEYPVMIVNPQEAAKVEKKKAKGTKTWVYKAENVRDFAFASSRKFIWDAQAVKFGDRTVLAMSYYPKEGNPLWEKYSTRVVAHTLNVYSKYTFDYPYPVAISVHTDKIGMEYPMICFNGGRPEKDGTYTKRTKYGMIGVIIHEVGHNYFPMIVNSDERQWTWMDEGLNSFLQYLTEAEWEREYPHRRGPAENIVDYMKGDKSKISPIMTNSESIHQFGNNAYGKPATALNILRETVLGRELFDFAFKEYSNRWMFKQPTPADLFRTMEDASGVDLDWFWRGWFYTTDHVDIALEDVQWFQPDSRNPEVEKGRKKKQADAKRETIDQIRNKEQIATTMTERYPELNDFYNEENPFEVTTLDKMEYRQFLDSLSKGEQKLLTQTDNYYQLKLRNIGGLPMPVILEFSYADGTQEMVRIPAEIWRMDADSVTKVFITPKVITSITLDPHRETADTDTANNTWPPKPQPSRFQLFKEKQKENAMQRDKRNKAVEKGSPR